MTFFLHACMPSAISDSAQLASQLSDSKQVASRNSSNGFHYMLRASDSKTLLVFIHGTPGDWTIFSPQLESAMLSERATLIALDRPGWGNSEVSADVYSPSLEGQSKLIGPWLEELKAIYRVDTLVLVGHSYGGSLVPRIAMDFPNVIDGIIVIAGDLSDQYPTSYWYNSVASWSWLQWMIPGSMVKANAEVMSLKGDLKQMNPRWSQLNTPLFVIQGSEDGLVDPRHADFAESVKTKNTVKVHRFESHGHLLHLEAVQQVNQVILASLNEIKKN